MRVKARSSAPKCHVVLPKRNARFMPCHYHMKMFQEHGCESAKNLPELKRIGRHGGKVSAGSGRWSEGLHGIPHAPSHVCNNRLPTEPQCMLHKFQTKCNNKHVHTHNHVNNKQCQTEPTMLYSAWQPVQEACGGVGKSRTTTRRV